MAPASMSTRTESRSSAPTARKMFCHFCRRTRWPTRFSIAWRSYSVNDPREQLRRYLEQRRELGERELVLDALSVEDALRIVAGTRRSVGAEDPARPSADVRHA